MYCSSVVLVHPATGPACVVLANNSRSPPPKRKPLAMKAAASSSEAHQVLHPAGFGSAAFPGSRPKFQSNYVRQGRGGRLFCTKHYCFGEVVDKNMLTTKFGMEDSPENRARLALNLINNADKTGQASRYVANLKDTYGYGCSTLCLVYNATGETLRHHDHKDWGGRVLGSEKFDTHDGYPEEIGNGQWAAFLHVQGQGESGSIGAVVYRGDKLVNDQDRYVLLAWKTPSDPTEQNKAYCRFLSSADGKPEWEKTRINLESEPHHNASSHKDESSLQVDAETALLSINNSPTFTAIIKRNK